MTTPRPLASLSPCLLARKGAARPAMRPQAHAMPPDTAATLDDLGWNDMGHATDAAAIPPVLVEREALADAIETPDALAVSATRRSRETARTGTTALTLRLDADRHLRLLLASAIDGRSAQQLLTQALDALLHSMPMVDALIAQLPPAKRTDR